MKLNVSEIVIGIFEKCKTCLQNKKWYLILPSRHGHFHMILILLVKMVELTQQHANTIFHWMQTLPLPIVAKNSVLNVVEFLDPSYPSFLIILKCCQLYWKLLCFSLLLVTVCRSVFDQPFRRLLQLSCFYNGSSQWLFKVKITCKRVNFMKK